MGDFYTLLSALIYAAYANYLKVKIPEEQESDFKFSWFFGFIGLTNDIIVLPFFPIFNALGIEKFEWPNNQTLVLLSANAIIGTVVSDYCWARSVCLLGPLITQIGITLTFPISLTIDLLKNGDSFTW